MLELGELDLQLPFLGARAPGENVENERGAVQHLAIEDALQVAALGRGKFVVENDGVHILRPAVPGKLVRLAAADEGGRQRGFEFLGAVAHHFTAGGGGEFGKFVQGFARIQRAAGLKLHPDEEDSFGSFRCGRD